MQVQKINNSVYQNSTVPAPNFKGGGLDPEIIKAITKDSKGFNRFLTYAGEKQGEALNILVTAFGTAVICPMFIRFNPFSKEDKQTRAYSAWRQPISAIIAVAAQLTITRWFNNLLATKASISNKDGEANYARADLRDCPHERHLKQSFKLEEHPEWSTKAFAKEVKKIHPEWNEEQIAKEVKHKYSDWKKDQIAKEIKRRQLNAEKAAITKARKEMKKDTFAIDRVISQNPEKDAKKLLLEEIQTEFKEEIKTKFGESATPENNKGLKRYLEDKLKEKAADAGKTESELIKYKSEHMVKGLLSQDSMEDAKKEIFDRFKVEFKDEIETKFHKPVDDVRSIKLNKFLESKLKEKAAAEGIDEIAFVQREAAKKMEKEILGEAVIKRYVRKLVEEDNGIKTARQALNFSEENTKKFTDGLIKYIKEDLKAITSLEEKVFGVGISDKAKNKKIEEFAKNIIEKLNCAIEYSAEHDIPLNMSLPKLGDSFDEVVQSVKIKKYKKGMLSDAKRVFKTQNTQKGLVVTLLTLPITCGILNWAYPRIMEYIMPEMAAKKKQAQVPDQKEGGDK